MPASELRYCSLVPRLVLGHALRDGVDTARARSLEVLDVIDDVNGARVELLLPDLRLGVLLHAGERHLDRNPARVTILLKMSRLSLSCNA